MSHSHFVISREITTVMTQGVVELGLSEEEMVKLYMMSAKRWTANNADYFTSVVPIGINLDVTNGNELIESLLISEFPNLKVQVYVIVDDYGEASEEGLVITILLPDEY